MHRRIMQSITASAHPIAWRDATGPTKNDGSHRRTNPESLPTAPPACRRTVRLGRSSSAKCVTTTRRGAIVRAAGCRMQTTPGITDQADRDWTRPDAIQKSSRMGNGRQVRNAGAGSRRPPRAGTLCTLAGCVDHAGEKMRAFQLS
jgi:hypothetical protein